jgi:biopolymer transport protein ExbD
MSDLQEAPLSPAQRSKIRRLSQPKEPQPGEEAGELNIVPYLDIITNVMIFVLASVSVIFVSSVDTTPPSIGGGKVRSEMSSKALNLSAFITTQGISLKTSGGNIAPGCKGVGSGVTVPMVNNDYDFTAVTACARDLKAASDDFKEETQVTITANPGIEFQAIIRTMDALRRDGETELFPDVHFGVAR